MLETFYFKISHQQEIEELKTKLGHIRRQRDEYSDAMKNGTAPPPVPPQQQTSTNSNNSDSDSQPSSPNLTRSTLNSFSDGSYNQSNGNSPHSSLRAHIRAFLPNNQRTMVRASFFCRTASFNCWTRTNFMIGLLLLNIRNIL